MDFGDGFDFGGLDGIDFGGQCDIGDGIDFGGLDGIDPGGQCDIGDGIDPGGPGNIENSIDLGGQCDIGDGIDLGEPGNIESGIDLGGQCDINNDSGVDLVNSIDEGGQCVINNESGVDLVNSIDEGGQCDINKDIGVDLVSSIDEGGQCVINSESGVDLVSSIDDSDHGICPLNEDIVDNIINDGGNSVEFDDTKSYVSVDGKYCEINWDNFDPNQVKDLDNVLMMYDPNNIEQLSWGKEDFIAQVLYNQTGSWAEAYCTQDLIKSGGFGSNCILGLMGDSVIKLGEIGKMVPIDAVQGSIQYSMEDCISNMESHRYGGQVILECGIGIINGPIHYMIDKLSNEYFTDISNKVEGKVVDTIVNGIVK
jgi:hypothetical protein